MKPVVTVVLVVAVAAVAATVAGSVAHARGDSGQSPVDRGRYLVGAMACNDCHTPFKMGPAGPEPDMARMLSGHPQDLAMPPAPQLPPGPWMVVSSGTNTAWAGPWGVSFTANLTPDAETGLGASTEQEFVDAMRTARHEGRGRGILPPMPVQAVASLTDADLRAVFAYLRSVPAVKNRVPQPLPPSSAR